MFISGKSSGELLGWYEHEHILLTQSRVLGVEHDVERQKLLDASEDFKKKWQAANGQVGNLQGQIAAAKQAEQAASGQVQQLNDNLQRANQLAQQRAQEVQQRDAGLAAATKALAEERDRRAAQEARARLYGGGRGRYNGGRREAELSGETSESSSGSSGSGYSETSDDRRRFYNRPRPAPQRPDPRYQARTRSPGQGNPQRRRGQYAPPPPHRRQPSPYPTSPPRRYRSPSPARHHRTIRGTHGDYDLIGYSTYGLPVYRGRRSHHTYEWDGSHLLPYSGELRA